MVGVGQPGSTDGPPSAARDQETAAFHMAIEPFATFAAVGDPALFVPLPEDWTVGLADVVNSSAAIAAGRYKSVNTAGASVISAVSNAIGTIDYPFLFAGDGASFAVGPRDAERATTALSATVAWVRASLDLDLRGGVLSVQEIRRHGFDVRVARFAASHDVSYAMFSGGGLGWAEQRLKAGALSVPVAPPDAQPDLTGLSCRFQDLRSRHGVILSILARPVVAPADPRFRALVADVLAIAEGAADAGRPIPVFRPLGSLAPRSITLNARFGRRPGETRWASLLRAGGASLVASVVLATGLKVGGFSARRYLGEVIANTDFRKYDDALMMTVDCSSAVADAVEACLASAERAGVIRFGLHRQRSATVTCVVPSANRPNHVHFIDGAAGGYAMAAQALKSQLVVSESV